MKTITIFDKEDMIKFALYLWKHGEGKTATYDGAKYHLKNYLKEKKK